MFHFKSLNRKLIALYCLILGVTLILALSIVELSRYSTQERELQKSLEQLSTIYHKTLTKAVWEYDFTQIRLVIDNFKANPNFRGAAIYDSSDQILDQAGNIDLKSVDPAFVLSKELIYESRFHTEPVGKLLLTFDNRQLKNGLIEHLEIDAAIVVFLLLVFAASVPLLNQRMLFRPMKGLQNAIEQLRVEAVREKLGSDQPDEIGQLIQAFNELQNGQEILESDLRKRNQELNRNLLEKKQELQKTQQLLNAILDNSSALIYLKQANGTYQIVNRAWCNQVNMEHQEVIGKTDYEIFAPELAAKYRESDLRVLGTGQPVSEEEPFRLNNSERTLISMRFPLLDDQRSCYATCGISFDITEQKKLEQELLAAKDRAEALERSKHDFITNLSHEIRNPMNGIIGFTTLTLKTELTEEQKDFLNNIRITANSLLALVNDIFDLSNIEAGKLALETTPFNLNHLLDGLADQLAEAAAKKNIELIVHKNPDVPDLLLGDRIRLRQILINLVGNAIKFTDQGEVVLSLSRAEHDPDRRTVRFSVRDTGAGIAAEQSTRLFSSLIRSNASVSRSFGGSGIGLAICKQLVTLMNGRIGVHSVPGKGSTFWCEIPFEPDEGAFHPSDAAELRFRVKKFLIVENNPTSLTVLEEMLQSFGFQTLTASDGAKALELLQQNDSQSPVDALFIDRKLPGMDGMETTAKIRAMDAVASLPIVLIGTFGDGLDNDHLKAAGVNGYLIKPIHRSTLFATLIDLFSERRHSAPAQAESLESVPDKIQFTGVSLLLVENHPGDQQAILEKLTKLGIHADLAVNGIDAIDAIRSKSYDLVLMDTELPELDGFQATAVIRRRFGSLNLPIIALTGSSTHHEQSRFIEAGMNESIPKPIDFNQLFEILMRWVKPPASLSLPLDAKKLPAEGHTPRPPPNAKRKLSQQTAKDAARRIRDAAFTGNLSELHSIAESLPPDSFWAHEISRLTDHFDFDGLEKLAHALDNLH